MHQKEMARNNSTKIMGLHPNVFFLGVVSFLTDVSSEMIFTLVPLFLSNVIGASTTIVGLVGGISDSTDAVSRIFSGWLSDRSGRRKPLALLGYGVSTIAKPFMYFALNWPSVLVIRFSDRVGKGLRNSPRDALIADSVSEKERGRSFGLHRGMDTLGAVLGLGIAAIIIYHIQGGGLQLGLDTYHWLVIVGTIPAVIGVIILALLVREKTSPAKSPSRLPLSLKNALSGFDNQFKIFLVIIALFNLGNSSDFFVILRAQMLGSSVLEVTLMLVAFNITYAVIAFPAGILSDRLGRRRIIAVGWLVYALVYFGFAAASSLWQIWLLFAGYGIYYGLVEGVGRAFVADLVPQNKRGTAYGLYQGIIGLVLLPASVIAGLLWQVKPVGTVTFYFGAGLAFLAMVGMMALIKEKQRSP